MFTALLCKAASALPWLCLCITVVPWTQAVQYPLCRHIISRGRKHINHSLVAGGLGAQSGIEVSHLAHSAGRSCRTARAQLEIADKCTGAGLWCRKAVCGGDMGTCAAATPDQLSQSLVEAHHPGYGGSSATMRDDCSTPVADNGAGTQPSASAAWPPSGMGAHAEPEPATDSVSSCRTTHVAEPIDSSSRPADSADSGGSAGIQAVGVPAGPGAPPAAPQGAALIHDRETCTVVGSDEGAGVAPGASAANGAGGTPAAGAEPAAGADRAAMGSSAGARASELQEKLVKQVEFYFSGDNLPTDAFLLKQVSKSPEGWGALRPTLLCHLCCAHADKVHDGRLLQD